MGASRLEIEGRRTPFRTLVMGEDKAWFLSSSGARPLYRENIVRVLAAPQGESVNFRYAKSLVCPEFVKALTDKKSRHAEIYDVPAYVSYLDGNSSPKETPFSNCRRVPVRQVKIRKVVERGSSIILTLEVGLFLHHENQQHLADKLSTSVLEAPRWDESTCTVSGYWVARCQPLAVAELMHIDRTRTSHLTAFEATVDRVSAGEDFKTAPSTFLHICGLRNRVRDEFLSENVLRAGEAYEWVIYHYRSPHQINDAWQTPRLLYASDREDVEILSGTERHVEAEYDEIVVPIVVKRNASDGHVGLQIVLTEKNSDLGETHWLRYRVLLELKADWTLNAVKVAFLTFGMTIPSFVALGASEKLDWVTGSVSLFAAAVAAVAATYSIRIRP